jgi:hypothetical protein
VKGTPPGKFAERIIYIHVDRIYEKLTHNTSFLCHTFYRTL